MLSTMRVVQVAWLGVLAMVVCVTCALVAGEARRQADHCNFQWLMHLLATEGEVGETPELARYSQGADRAERRARWFGCLAICSGLGGTGLLVGAGLCWLKSRNT